MVVEMLLSDMPDQGYKWNDADVAEGGRQPPASTANSATGPSASASRSAPSSRRCAASSPKADVSHPAMAVNLDACIQCNRCVRACREEQVNDVIGYAMRGEPVEDRVRPRRPDGRQHLRGLRRMRAGLPDRRADAQDASIGSQLVDRKVDSVCPFCGVGCLITYNVKDEKIVSVDGRDGPANHSRLCVKGRFGFDYAHHPQRLTKPLIRKPGVPKDFDDAPRPGDWQRRLPRSDLGRGAGAHRPASSRSLRDTHGKKALAGFGSAKGSNEEAYLFQKLVRTGFGSNNVDHCTRLCHASSVAALLEGVGSGAVSNQVNDVEHAELIFVIGSNPTANHPVAATWMKNAAKRGAKIVLADPRRTDIGKHAWRTLQFKADTDVAMLNALIHAVIDEGLVDEAFVRDRASNFEALRENVKGYSPEAMAPICGIPAETLREVARAFATAKGAMVLWGMGISQHVHGTDNARCLIALVTVTGQIGKPGSGLHPLRGQNNVQGASDAGLIPMMFPNYQRVDNAGRARLVREVLGHAARRDARLHGGRDHAQGAGAGQRSAQDPRHVHHGREPRDERPGPEPRAPRAGEPGAPGGAGHLHDRDRLAGRRGAARQRLAREDRHGEQHRPHGAARQARARTRRAMRSPTSGSSSRSRSAWACTGTTKARNAASPRSTTRCARPCTPPSAASPGSGCSANRA